MIRIHQLFILLFFILHAILVFPQTQIPAGNVSGTWTKEKSPYIINGKITIQSGNILEIEPGVQIYFNGYYKLLVYGILKANGAEGDSILFTTDIGIESWNGIRFNNISAFRDSSFIDYCIIEKGLGSGVDNNGGGIYLNTSSKVRISNCRISNNKAYNGAGIYCTNSSPVILNNLIYFNEVEEDGAGINCSSLSSPTIYKNHILGNIGAGVICLSESNPEIRSNIIENNHFCGIYVHGHLTKPLIIDNKIYKNDGQRGGINIQSQADAILINNIICHNRPRALAVSGADATLINNTIAFNYGNNSGVIDIENSSPVFYNNIIYFNEIENMDDEHQIVIEDIQSTPKFVNNDIQGGFEGFRGNGAGDNYDNSQYIDNIDSDPKFQRTPFDSALNVSLNDFDFRLNKYSPCIDAGANSINGYSLPETDIAGNSRIMNASIDIGAFENEVKDAYCGQLNEKFTLWGDTILINCNITIPSDKTLEIRPGTKIIFQGKYKIVVKGTILANGTKNDSIHFTTTSKDQNWQGIWFDQISQINDSSILSYCVFERGYGENETGVLQIIESSKLKVENCLFYNNYKCIELENSNIAINSNVFKYNNHNCIVPSANASPVICGNTFMNNALNCIELKNSSPLLIINNLFVNNNTAIKKSGGYQPDIVINNTIAYNNTGILLQSDYTTDNYNNIIYKNKKNVFLSNFTNAQPIFMNNNIQDGMNGIQIDDIYTFNQANYTKNIDSDPQFVKPSLQAGPHIDASGLDFNIQHNSECIDAGTLQLPSNIEIPEEDYYANPRIKRGKIDIGAIEYQGFQVCANISKNTTWDADTVKLINDVTIEDNVTLTINPGTVVEFQGHYIFNVQGRLLAVGTKQDSIWFTTTNDDVKWGGIRFENISASNDSSKIIFCDIHRAQNLNDSGDEADGGAIFVQSFSKIKISSCNIHHNQCFGRGAGICFRNCNGIISNNIISENIGDSEGGGIIAFYSHCSIINNKVYNNTASWGGGICTHNGNSYLYGNLIFNNQGNQGGGFASIYASNPILINNTIINNYSKQRGGNLYFICSGSGTFINNIISKGNCPDEGKQICIEYVEWEEYNLLPIFNYCIIENGISEISVSPDEYLVNLEKNITNVISTSPLISNIIENGISVNANHSNFRLLPTSPCIDAGLQDMSEYDLPETDIYNHPRIYNGRIDIGANEYIGPTAYGHITENTIWDADTIKVTDDVFVDDGVTLTIEPGTVMEFQGYYELLVKGRLLSKGQLNDSIVFTTPNQNIKWHGIHFFEVKNNNYASFIEYTIIEKGQTFASTEEHLEEKGGGIFAYNSIVPVRLSHSVIRNNEAVSHGGGICCQNAVININNCKFYNNKGWPGGGIAIINGFGNDTISNCIFYNNEADLGGGIHIANIHNSYFCNNVFAFNHAIDGGGVQLEEETCFFYNNSIINNKANKGGGIFCSLGGNSIFKNCIISGNREDNQFNQLFVADIYSQPNISYSIVQGGMSEFSGTDFQELSMELFKNNIDESPKFYNIPESFGNIDDISSVRFDLLHSSPCINAGTPDTTGLNLPATDIIGNPRIAGGQIDIGAYEVPAKDLSITEWISPQTRCNLTESEQVSVKIKNYGVEPQSNFSIKYSINGGINYASEIINQTIQPGDSLVYTFTKTANFATKTGYECIAIANLNGDKQPQNDTVKLNVTSFQLELDLGDDIHLCAGQDTLIGAIEAFASYSWSGEQTSQSIRVSQEGDYTLTVENDDGCRASDLVNVTLHELPAPPAANDANLCEGDAFQGLSATGTNIRWFNDDQLGELVHTGNIYNPGISKAGLYTFYATQADLFPGCTSPAAEIGLTIASLPDPPDAEDVVTGAGQAILPLTATGTNIQWYADAEKTNLLKEGATFNTGRSEVNNYTFFVTQTVDGCESSPKEVVLSIIGVPAPPAGEDLVVCEGEETELTATGTNVQWYETGDTITVIHTGETLQTNKSAVGTYQYLATQTINDIEGIADTITLTIKPTPSPPTAQNATIYEGEPTPALSANGENVQWFDNASLENLVHTGQTFQPNESRAGIYSFYTTQTVDGCQSAAQRVELSIFENVSEIQRVVCFGEPVPNLEVVGQTVEWFTDSKLENLDYTGSSFATGKTAPGTYIWFVRVTNNNVASEPVTVSLAIKALPPKPEFSKAANNYCPGDTLTCLNYDELYTYQWYKDYNELLGQNFASTIPKGNQQATYMLKVSENEENATAPYCSNKSDSLFISSKIPEAILKGDKILICKNLDNEFTAWQWCKDESIIPGAFEQFYVADEAGDYHVEATNLNGCQVGSNHIQHAGTTAISIHPTLANDFIYISSTKEQKIMEVSIYSNFGKRLKSDKFEGNKIELYMGSFMPGLYAIEVITEDEKVVEFIMKNQ